MRGASPATAPSPSSSSDDEQQQHPPNPPGPRRAATDPGDCSDALLAAAGATLTARRTAARQTARKAGKASGGPLLVKGRRPVSAGGVGSVPGGRRPGARLAPLGGSPDDAGATASALRSWLTALATAPAASRYAKHTVAVVRTALRLLEAKR